MFAAVVGQLVSVERYLLLHQVESCLEGRFGASIESSASYLASVASFAKRKLPLVKVI